MRDARAEVVAVRRQTARSVTLTLRPNSRLDAASAPASSCASGSRSTACAAPAPTRRPARSTAARARADRHDPPRRRSSRAICSTRPARGRRPPGRGAGRVHAARPRGPSKLVLISGGSGITPVLSMLRTLCDEGHDGEVDVPALRADRRRLAVRGRGRGARRRAPQPPRALRGHPRGWRPRQRGDAAPHSRRPRRAPRRRLRPARADRRRARVWTRLDGDPDRLLAETFTPPACCPLDAATPPTGTLRFLRSDRRAAIAAGHAARAGRGRRALARVRLPDGHLPHLHLPQARRCRAQPAHRRGLRRGGRGHPALHVGPRRATSRSSSEAT